jgi:ketosteroid isomerase-like protein
MATTLTAAMDDFQRCIEERDQARAEQILDDDYVLELVQPSVARMPRDRWLEVLPDYLVHAYEVQEQVLSVEGDCAVILQRVLMEATVLGEDRSGCFVLSDVWRLREGTWRLWRRHSTPISAGHMPGVRS